MNLNLLKSTHDLESLPAWGPYAKQYIGISHIPNPTQGLRFDLSVFPGVYRKQVNIPNVLFESGYHPWEASSDLNYFCFRHEVEWKDQVYTDIAYARIDESSRLIRIDCVNKTDAPQNLVIHLMASMHFPPLKEYAPETPLVPAAVSLPDGAVWIDALDYEELYFAAPRPDDSLGYDGKLRGEIRANGFVNGSGIGRDFGKDAGDRVTYYISCPNVCERAVLLLRYRLRGGKFARFQFSGLVNCSLSLPGDNKLAMMCIPVGRCEQGEYWLSLESQGGAVIEIDGFTIVESYDMDRVRFTPVEWNYAPQILEGPEPHSLILKYQDSDTYYGIRWGFQDSQIRQFFCRELDVYFRRMAHEHVQTVFHGEGDGHFTNIFLRPIVLKAQSSRQIYATVCSGALGEVERSLAECLVGQEECEALYRAARERRIGFESTSAGKVYTFSQEKMAVTTACNVVYPVYTQRSYIRHNTPGRWWDCLYTWDSGFIGLGLLEFDTQRAIECLNAYMMDIGAQSAFLHHGSPVPVQHYLFLELWNRTQSQELLTYFYPRLRQYHQFMAGRLGSSTTNTLRSHLLRTWDYFYNSGGWDDYPPQVYVRRHRLEDSVTPVITTAQVIRTARILRMAALALGEDIAEFDRDIGLFSEALQTHAWDEDSGYFGYVQHDGKGSPQEILRHESGDNFNRGFDGAYPLIAGICTPNQETRLLAALMSPEHMWSACGLSAVDRSSPYYREDGYWNGTVWMSHQWFFWKTMFDLNQPDFAWKIASTGLEVWRKEVETSYHCMEHFIIETGRGAGWHEFGGLSTPILSWFNAYYAPGHLTTGLNVWVTQQQWNADQSSLTATLKLYGTGSSRRCAVVACLNPAHSYRVFWNGQPVGANSRLPGVMEIPLPYERTEGRLYISENSKAPAII